MYNSLLKSELLFEQRFWLQILGDHSRFILNSLSPNEEREIETAKNFIILFDDLLERVWQELSDQELVDITRQAYHYGCEIRTFKIHLLKRHLVGSIKISLPPTFFNHMLNEVEEYLGILTVIFTGNVPHYYPLHHHLLWLLDAVGHAASIEGNLDEVEKTEIKRAKEFKKEFSYLHDKAVEMAGYMRTNLQRFPALDSFNSQAEGAMIPFIEFLEKSKEKRLNKEQLGTLMPLIADHMAREECYYLTKLSMVSDVKKPDCDPTRPRLK